VIVNEGDIVWTKSGVKLVKVVKEITEKTMLSEPSFLAWYTKNFME